MLFAAAVRRRSQLLAAGRHYRRLAQRWPFLPHLCVFTVSGLVAIFLQSTPTFADPDSFYHARMATLVRDRGVFTTFPWLQFTVLNDRFTDHQFLYHLAVIPFVTAWPPLVGLKLATVVFFACAVTAFFALLGRFGVRGAWFPTAVLLVSSPFLFRANLAKAQALAFTLLFIFLGTLTARQPVPTAVVSFAYVWLYGGWPLLPVLAGLYLLASVVRPLPSPRRWLVGLLRRVQRVSSGHGLTALATVGGVVGGLVFNPYFPHNIGFYWNQVVQIAVIGYRGTIGVGAEWYPFAPLELLAASSIATFAAAVGATIFVLTVRRQSPTSVFLLLATSLFYGLTWRSRRNVEYLIPFALLFTAMSIHHGVSGLPWRQFARELATFFREQKLFFAAAVLPLVFTPYIVVRDVVSTRAAYAQGIPFTAYAAASAWLVSHSPPGALVFHSDWDDFPVLFYHNTHNRYVVGLDPTFMYRFDPVRYWQWERVTTGRERVKLYDVIANRFGARYVLVGSEQSAMGKLVAKNPGFREVYHDQEARIFAVLPPPEFPNSKRQIPNNTQ